MEKESKEKIYDHARQTLVQGEHLTDGQLYDLTKALSETLVNLKPFSSQAYDRLLAYLKKFETFMLKEEERLAFSAGEVLGMTMVANNTLEINAEENMLAGAVNRYRGKYPLFKAVHESPGITHKTLARKVNISISNLSHFMGDESSSQYFASVKIGRDKLYYLSRLGRELYELMRERYEDEDRSILESSATLNLDNSFEESVVGEMRETSAFSNIIDFNDKGKRSKKGSRRERNAIPQFGVEDNVYEG